MEQILNTFCRFANSSEHIPRLKRNMTQLIGQQPEYNIEAWARHFILRFPSIRSNQAHIEQVFNLHPEYDTDEDDTDGWARHFIVESDEEEIALASDHLTAYLTKIGIRAGRRVYNSSLSHSDEYSLEDVLQIAFSEAANPEDFFHNFLIFRSSDIPSRVENYAITRMQNRIRNQILSTKRYEGRSHWFMLKNCTELDFRIALKRCYSTTKVDKYWQIVQCFREVYAGTGVIGGSRSLPNPTEEQVQQMAELYQMLSGEEISPKDIFWLDGDSSLMDHKSGMIDEDSGMIMRGILPDCIQALRSYFNSISTAISLHTPIGEEHDTDLGNLIEEPTTNPETIEESELTAHLTEIIPRLFEELNLDEQNLLLLHCGFQFTYRTMGRDTSHPECYIYHTDYTGVNRTKISPVLRRLLIFFAIDYLLSTLPHDLASEHSYFLARLRQLDYLSRTIVVLHYYMGIEEKEIASAGLLKMSIKKVREILKINTPSEDPINLDRSVIDNLIDNLPEFNKILKIRLKPYCFDILRQASEIIEITEHLDDQTKGILRLHYHPPTANANNDNAMMSAEEIASYLLTTTYSEEVNPECIELELENYQEFIVEQIKKWIRRTNPAIHFNVTRLSHINEQVCLQFIRELTKLFAITY